MTIQKFSPEALEKLARCFRLLMQLPDAQEERDVLAGGLTFDTQVTNDGEEDEGVNLKEVDVINETA